MIPDTLVRRAVADYFEAIRTHDRARWLVLFAEDAEQHDPVGAPSRKGREAIGEFWDEKMAALKDVSIQEADVLVAGSFAVTSWHLSARAPDGTALRFSGVDVFQIDATGRIASVYGFWNPPGA